MKKIFFVLLFLLSFTLFSCDDYYQDNINNPNITITEIEEDDKNKEEIIGQEIADGQISDIHSLVLSSITKNLENSGFVCKPGLAESINDDSYLNIGLYYYDNEIQLYNDNNFKPVGFVDVCNSEKRIPLELTDESVIVINDLEDINIDEDYKIYSYSYQNILPYHFIYKDKYVSYYQETSMRVVYDVYENIRSNYDLGLGSIYDYDNNRYIYDETLNGPYENHSGIGLFKDEDYEKLESELKKMSETQLNNGYSVDEYKIVYISPESIDAYLKGYEEDTFFGYSVNELTEEFGLGTALEYTENGFVESKIISNENSDSYNWKNFLIKIGVGCGILLVGAILTPITGGASFGCALLTISQVAISMALTTAIGEMAVELCTQLIQGKEIKDALLSSAYAGLDGFANGFIIGAAIGSVGVVSGAIKPKACFVSGTLISTINGLERIEDINVGDYVLSFNEKTKKTSYKRVYQLFEKEVDETVLLNIDGEIIETTPNHPFYLQDKKVCIETKNLKIGDKLQNSNGYVVEVIDKKIEKHDNKVKVYNFSVEDNHNYYVSNEEVLVHNDCKTIKAQRKKAVNDAWKKEVEAVKKGESKYNWTDSEIKELLKIGKVKGYEGHHIIPVSEVVNTAKSSLISDPKNIVFLSKKNHAYIHKLGDSFVKTKDRLLEVVPWVEKILPKLL